MNTRTFLSLVAVATGFAVSLSAAEVYSLPEGERIYGGYAVEVDGAQVPVSEVRCSAIPFNRRWPGHQRQIEQTELCGMVRFAFGGKATVRVTAAKDFKSVKVRPLSRNVAVRREGRTVAFDVVRPGGYSVEFDGSHNNLHVFADATKEYALPPSAIRFGPGVHDIGIRELKGGDTVYIDSGAIVYGGFRATNAADVAILGRGILDGGRLKEKILFDAAGDGHEAVQNAKRWHAIDLRNCRNVKIDGIVIRDSLLYNIAMWGCEDVSVSGVKIVGQWRFNTDGIDLHNCRRARVLDCFARTYDDTFCFKAHEGYGDCEDCVFERCVAWNDWGKAFEVGVECRAENLRRLAFRDCDCIHAVSWVMDVSNVDYGRVSDVTFEDIRVESDEPTPSTQLQKADDSKFDPKKGIDAPPRLFLGSVHFHHEYSKENGGKWSGGGFIDGVKLRNVKVTTDGRRPFVKIAAIDERHRPENVVFENLTVNGMAVDALRSASGIVMELGKDAVPPKFLVDDATRMNSEEMNPGSALGCCERRGGGAFKVLIYGNSIALHGRAPKIGWDRDWGMAASSRDRDFAHLVVAGLEARRGEKADFRIRNLAVLERNFRTNLTDFADLAADVAYAPDYVVVAIGENVPSLDGAAAADYTKFLAALAKPLVESAKRPPVVMRSPFWRNAVKADCTARAAKEVGAIYVDAGPLGDDESNMAIGLFDHKGVARHPGDLGMRRLADLILAAIDNCGKWPFIVIRHTGAINSNPKVFAQLMESHRRYRGACDEFWFAAGDREKPEIVAKRCADFARFRPLCDDVGIALSYQQGLTLGHGEAHDGKAKPGEQKFPDDAWQVGPDGKVIPFLCPRSPAVLAYERAYAKAVIGAAAPASYWLDDDLRLGVHKPMGCFCPRCIEAFNAKTGGKWTRETLAARIFSPSEREPLRAAWLDFNAESLAVYAAVVRQAADELKSPCRLAYQSVWADTTYTASSYLPLLRALSGPERRPVGIRPGAGFYVESEPRGMVAKCLSVAREAERCRGYGGLVASVCYEQETYPRHVLHKSPGAIMTECALALASGCDSLSLYWYSASAPEPVEEYDRFVRTLSVARPYFERLAASTKRTRLGGVARFLGSAVLETKGFDLRDSKDFDLACAGVPVTVAEADPGVWYLTAKSHAAMTAADKAKLAADAVVNVDDIEKYPLASRRRKLLDDLDRATGGRFPARVDECRPLRILPRVRADGSLDSVTLLNLSIGETDALAVRVRRPASGRAVWRDANGAEQALPLQPGLSEGEMVVKLSSLPGWKVGTVFFE